MPSRLLIFSVLFGGYALAFDYRTITYPALVVTKTATTKTVSLSYSTPSTTVVTIPDATFSLPALTITQPVQPNFCQGSEGNNCADIESIAPDATTFNPSQLSAIVSQAEAVISTYMPNQPFQNAVTYKENLSNEILPYFDPGGDDDSKFVDRVVGQLWPFLPSAYITDALNALSPLPSLQAELSSQVSSARSYFAPLEVAERGIVASELSLTGAAPSWINYAASIAASGAGGTSASSTGTASSGTASTSASVSASSTTSGNAAAPTSVDSLLLSACVAAAGILGVVNL